MASPSTITKKESLSFNSHSNGKKRPNKLNSKVQEYLKNSASLNGQYRSFQTLKPNDKISTLKNLISVYKEGKSLYNHLRDNNYERADLKSNINRQENFLNQVKNYYKSKVLNQYNSKQLSKESIIGLSRIDAAKIYFQNEISKRNNKPLVPLQTIKKLSKTSTKERALNKPSPEKQFNKS